MTDQVAARGAREMLARAAMTATATMSRADVEVRELQTLEQLADACGVLEQVWGIRPGQAFDVQPHLLRALGHGGNYLVGAYRAGSRQLIGASAAFFTEPLGSAMHSHITGVLAGNAGQGVGAALKWHQRRWALERGLGRITWTFDPLIARNAFFNLTRLGARPETYFVDFYGPMDDGPNRGQPSDRVEVVWDLASTPTVEAEGFARSGLPGGSGPDVETLTSSGVAVVLAVGENGEPVTGRPPLSGQSAILVAVPQDVERLRRADPALALAWRYELRAALALLLVDACWHVTGFARSGWYLLERRPPGVNVVRGTH